MRKLLLIATLSIFTALSLTGCSEQDVDKAVQKVGEVIEDNKISQEQLDSAEDKFNTVMDKTSEAIDEAKEAILEEVEKSTEEVEETTEEETNVDDTADAGPDSVGVGLSLTITSNPNLKSSDAGNESVGFDVEKATRVSASDVKGEDHDVTFAKANEAAVADRNEVAVTSGVLAVSNSEFNTRNLFYKTNCIEDVETYANIVTESRSDEPDGRIGLDIRKMVANDAYLKALGVLSKIDFEDISVSSKLVNKYNEGEEEFTKALVEILSAM